MKRVFKLAIVVVLLITTLIRNDFINNNEQEVVHAAGDVGICDQITANNGYDDACGEGQVTFLNASFEDPPLTQTHGQFDHDTIPGWFTTSNDKTIEVWRSDFAVTHTGTQCQDGNQCVEINANDQASLYQDFEVKPGQTIYYSFYHMGRVNNSESLQLRMGKPNDVNNRLNPTMGAQSDIVLTSQATRGVWTQRFGVFHVPEDFAADGENVLRIAFLSANASTVGNLIDNIEFYTQAVYDNKVEIAKPAGEVVSPTTDIFHVTNELTYFDRDTLYSDNSSVRYELSPDIEFVASSLTVEGLTHSNYTYAGDVLTVTNLPEVYENIDIEFDVKLKATPNTTTMSVNSYFEYSSKLATENFPTTYETHNISDITTLNVSYFANGYCDLITANEGYSDDCSVDTNIVYDNIISITDQNPTELLEDKVFLLSNTLENLNTDKELDESTTDLVYEYNKSMEIDESSFKINGVIHSDIAVTSGVGGNMLEVSNLPNYGISDYNITFEFTYNFNNKFSRDVFSDSFNITSKLDYENTSTSSFVYDSTTYNTSFSTDVDGSTTLSDASGNNLLAVNEVVTGEVRYTNNSPIILNNVEISLASDTSKLSATPGSTVVKIGTDVLVLGVDYTLTADALFLNSLGVGEEVVITYQDTALSSFSDANKLSNVLSMTADEFTDGVYLLQEMEIDIEGSTDYEISSNVTDNANNYAGVNEELEYTIGISNTGSFVIDNATIDNFISDANLDSSSVSNLVVKNTTTSTELLASEYSYSGNKLVINELVAGNDYEVVFNIITVPFLSAATEIVNNFTMTGLDSTGSAITSKTTNNSIPISEVPDLTVTPFVQINVGDTFNILDYVSVSDREDGTITTGITYTPNFSTASHGVHNIVVKVVDSDGRETADNIVVLVDDGNYVVGTNYMLYAKDFNRYVNQVVVDDLAVKQAVGVTVHDKRDGSALTGAVTVNLGDYKAVAGDYDITFSVTSEPTTTKTIVGSVLSGNPPTLNGVDFVEINVGDAFDPMDGVTANDDFDGNLTNEIVVTGSVDNMTAGVYTLEYEVDDNDNNITTATRVVLVNDGTYVAGDNFIIQAKDYTIRVGQVSLEDDAIIVSAQERAFNKLTGEELNKEVTVDKGSYAAVEDEYDITFSFIRDPSAEITIQATVISGDEPTITADDFTEISVGGSLDLLTGVTADDNEDGVLTAYIDVEESLDVNTAGVYPVKYTVEDSDKNVVEHIRVVLVNDGTYKAGTSRIIKAEDFYKLVTDVDTSDSAVISDASVVLYDKTSGEEILEPIQVTLNGYSAVVNTYNVTFTSTVDSSATITIVADVSTGYDPEIITETFVEIDKGVTFDPLVGVSATDIEDGDLTGALQVVTDTVDSFNHGVYYVDYRVSDSQGNTTDLRKVVLVNDGNYVIGSSHIIYATDFTLTVSQVDTSDAGIIEDASAAHYSKTTGDRLADVDMTIDSGTYTNVADVYDIEFVSDFDATAVTTIKATVSIGNVPELNVPAFVEVNVGDEFNPLTGVTATDVEDDDITLGVIYTGNVDTSVDGVNVLEYKIKDSDGNEVVKSSVVLVNDGTYIVGDVYIITANDFTKRVSQVDTSEAAITIDADYRLYSKQTGLLQSIDTVIATGGYTDTPGDYQISFTVQGDSVATREITAKVIGGEIPTITGIDFVEINVGDTFDSLAGVEALDEEDGDITSKLRLSGNVNVNVAGIYKKTYTIEDSDRNVVEETRIIVVNDGRYKVTTNYIIKAKDYTVLISDVDTSDNGIVEDANFTIYDKATGDETNPWPVVTGDKGAYTNELGIYQITFYVLDNGDLISKVINAEVIGGNVPEITTDTYVKLNVGDPFDPLSGVTASDIEDGDLTSRIVADSNLDTSVAGVYTISYSVVDDDFNVVTVVKVVVVGDDDYDDGRYVVIRGNNFTKRISEVDATNQGIIDDAGLEVYLKTTGENITDNVVLNIATGYTNAIGDYPINATIAEDRIASMLVVGSVVAGESPEIIFDDIIIVDQNSSFSAIEDIIVTDAEEDDGILIGNLIITGSVDTSVVGIYNLTYEVTDTDGNTTVRERTVVVSDGYYSIVGDYIVYSKDFNIDVDDVVLDKDDIIDRSDLVVYDKDGNMIDYDDITIDYGDYTNSGGKYVIKFSVNGSSVSIPINVTVIDDSLPPGGNSSIIFYVILFIVLLYGARKFIKK